MTGCFRRGYKQQRSTMTAKFMTSANVRPHVLLGLLALLLGGSSGFLVTGTTNIFKLFAIVLGIGFVLLTLFRVEWGVIALIIINYTNLSDIAIKYHGLPSISQPFIALLFFAIFMRWLLYGGLPPGWKTPLTIIGAYTLTGIIAPLYSANVDQALRTANEYVKYPVVALLIVLLVQRGEMLRWVMWTLVIVGIFLGTISCYQYLTGTFDNNYGGFAVSPVLSTSDGGEIASRITGPIGDPNFYAQTMLVLVPLALECLYRERSWLLRALAVWSLVVCIGTIFATLSRGAFLGLAVVAIFWIVRHPPKPLSLIVLLVSIAILLPVIPAQYTNRIDTLYSAIAGPSSERLADQSFRGRTSEAIAAIMMFADNPLIGVGLGNYNVHYQDYSRQLGLDPRREDRSAHNLYLEIAAERGLFGLTAFGVLMVVMFRSMWRARTRLNSIGLANYASMVDALTIGLTSYMVTSIFLHDAYPRYFWVLVGVALATEQVARNEMHKHANMQNNWNSTTLRLEAAASSV